MSVLERIEKNKVKITFEVGPERFEEGLQHAYNTNKGKINVAGFRKGKAPRKIIEVQFGKEVFYEDAFDFILPDALDSAIEELGLEPVSKPSMDVLEVSAEKGVTFVAEIYTKPEVEIDGYVGLTYKVADLTVTEEDIDKMVDADREKNSRLITVERPIEENDIVTLNFAGYMDGVAFDGGTAQNHELTIGSKQFIAGFEDQLVGHVAGDDLDVNIVFPENYHSEELSGKPAVFKVEILEVRIKELPEANDDFAQDVSEFETYADYRNSLKEKIAHEKEHAAEHEKEDEIIKQLIEKAVMDVPEVMFENRVNDMLEDVKNNFSRQGITLEMYLQYTGMKLEDMKKMYRANAEISVKSRLALEAVTAKENINITDEEFETELTRIAAGYKMPVDVLKSRLHDHDIDAIKKDMKVQRALQFVIEKSVPASEI